MMTEIWRISEQIAYSI